MKKKKENLFEKIKEKQIIKKILKKDFEYINKHKQKNITEEVSNIEYQKNVNSYEKDLNQEIMNAINVSNKSILRREDNTPDNIWFALINPERATEIRAWLFGNKLKALILRGPQGETMLHWAVLSEYSLILDLVDAGININCQDKNGRTPMDWIVDRYWELCVLEKENIPYQGLLKLKAQTEELGTLVYSLGGRPTDFENISEEDNNSAAKMAMGGAFWYIESLYRDKGLSYLKNWLNNKRSVIHVWILSSDDGLKYKNLEQMIKWGLSIDEKDIDGRSPLWYLIEGWSLGSQRNKLEKVISQFLEMGADPDLEDNEGVSPRLILNLEYNTIEDMKYIENLINAHSKK